MSRITSLWQKSASQLLSVLRIVSAFLFMQHGSRKLFGIPGGEQLQLIPFEKLFTLAPGLAGILELGGGLLLLVGLFTRPVAFVLSGLMAFAYFMAHFPRHPVFPILNHGELAVLFCFAFLYLSAAGGGPWSLDRLRRRGTTSGRRSSEVVRNAG